MINNKHLFYLMIFTQFGSGMIGMPNNIYNIAGHDGWISCLIGGVFVQILLFLYYRLYKKFPSKSFTDYTKIITNPFIGTCINICYYLYFVYVVIVVSLRFSDIITIWIFPKSPSWLILILFLLTAYQIANKDLQTIARTYILCSFILIFYILLLIYAYKDIHFGSVLPIGQSSISKIGSGSYWSFIEMLGFEIFLFITPSFQNSNKKIMTLTFANIFNTLLCTFTIFTSYIRLSNKENSYIIDPILYIFKTYHSKMVESLDTIYLSLCTIQICATIVTYLYIISESVHKRLFVIVKSRNSILFTIILIVFAFYPLISLRVIKREDIVHFGNYLDPVFIIMIPFLLLLIHKVRALIK
ncbi:hypothetical protein CN692_19480 [Bacillus sp. AFS002410]|uniref:GerAB/ArcD/ProY family transporter n=1 Tax=Bacillus sp. AFS002410 TaxID=2033481 RepID=UPI000BF13FEE|nr:GerAB/ArcD/ProY family transporter [Bacillus sp. AFS002410]PEJ54517.1 hypothetical protein CN692_19480 [Bacillus sp. AFS002410]